MHYSGTVPVESNRRNKINFDDGGLSLAPGESPRGPDCRVLPEIVYLLGAGSFSLNQSASLPNDRLADSIWHLSSDAGICFLP